MLKIYGRLLLGSSFAALAVPSLAVCSIDNGNTAKGAGKPMVDCWIYPEDGGEGKIVKLEEGADAPEGYAFQPAPPKPDAEVLDEEGIEATQLEQAKARIAELEAENDALTEEGNDADNAKLRSVEASRDQLNGKLEEAHKTVGIQEKQIKKLQGKIETLEAEKSSLTESAQKLQDENEELKKASEAAKDSKPEGGGKEK